MCKKASMKSSIRSSAVAGQFYPGEKAALQQTIQKLAGSGFENKKRQKVLAVVSPHAGYVYSGAIAAETLARIRIPETVILLGPNHTGQGSPIALSTATWEGPLGSVPVDQEFAATILSETEYIKKDELAHCHEHSLEVQIPFLQVAQPNLSIVPITISHISYKLVETIGHALARCIKKSGKDILILASSDMTHYEPREVAKQKDHLVLEKLAEMQPEILYNTVIENKITMCGIMPVTISLIASLDAGATKTELVRYSDSGKISGDPQQVVGYAGVLIF